MKSIFIGFLLFIMATVFLGCSNESTSSDKSKEIKTTAGYKDKIPDLISQLGSIEYDARIRELKEIVSYGSDALPQLAEASKHADPNKRYYSLRALG